MSLLPSLAKQATEENQAEVLLWQARYRAIFVPLVGFSTVTLKWFGVISSESLLITSFSPRQILGAVIALVVAYLVGHRLLASYLKKTKRASASIVVPGRGRYAWSGPGMAADVQRWLANPATNGGWLLRTSEGPGRVTAMRIERGPSQGPLLSIDYVLPRAESARARISSSFSSHEPWNRG